MGVSYVGKGAYTYGTSDISVPMPSGIQENDFLLLKVENPSSSATIATPSGWTPVADPTPDSPYCEFQVFWKFASTSESSVTLSVSSALRASVSAWRGVKTSAAINAYNAVAYDGAVNSIQNPTSTVDGCMLVCCIGHEESTNPGANDTTNFSDWSNSSLESMTEGEDYYDTSFDRGGGIAFAYGLKVYAGSLANTSIIKDNTTYGYAVINILLTPASYTAPIPPPSFIGQSIFTNSGGTLTVKHPASAVVGNFLTLFVNSYETQDGWCPTGWTPVADEVVNTNSYSRVFYKIYETGDGDISVPDFGRGQCAIMAAWEDVDSANPINAYLTDTSDGTAFSTDNPTSTKDNCMLINFVGFFDNGADDTTNYSSWSNSSLESITEEEDDYDSSPDTGISLVYGVKKTAGSIGVTTATTDSSQNKSTITSVLLQPVQPEANDTNKFFMFL